MQEFDERYENFSVKGDNLSCPDCGDFSYSKEFWDRVQVLRWLVDRPFIVAPGGGFRCRFYNETLKYFAPDSRHLFGAALDVSTKGWPGDIQWFFIEQAQNLGFSIGTKYPTWIHIDLRDGKPVRF